MSWFKWQEFIPESYLSWKKGYTLALLKKDAVAGLTVALITIPLSIAFAVASGATPSQGLITAVIAGFLTSLLGGSRVLIGGPCSALIAIVYMMIQKIGYQGVCLSMLLSSFILIFLGIFKLGSWIKYIPVSLIIGCMSGIAVSIFSSQIRDLLGLHIENLPSGFIESWGAYFHALPTMHFETAILGLGGLVFIVLIQRFAPKIPWSISIIILVTAICSYFDLSTETIQSRFGNFPKQILLPSFPHFSISPGELPQIITGAITLAILISIESLISAVIGERLIGKESPRSNCELFTQGIANMGSAIFGGIPAAGSPPRTVANAETGAKTPIAGIIHAIALFFILYFFFPIVGQIPLTALAAVLIIVSWKMFDFALFIRLLKAPIEDCIILISAFFFTVFFDIRIAFILNLILSALIFMRQISRGSKIINISSLYKGTGDNDPISKEIMIYEIRGPIFFGNDHILKDLPFSKILILQMQSIPIIDAAGILAIEELHEKCEKRDTILLLSGIRKKIIDGFVNFGFIKMIHKENVFHDLSSALRKGKEILKSHRNSH